MLEYSSPAIDSYLG